MVAGTFHNMSCTRRRTPSCEATSRPGVSKTRRQFDLFDMGIFPIYNSVMSRSVATPSPAQAANATSPISSVAVARAIAKVLRPLVRLAIKAGLKYADIDQLVREALFDEAQSQCNDQDRRNGSKLSMMTGMHRKEVALRLAAGTQTVTRNARAYARSAAQDVFTKWAYLSRLDPRRRSLPIADVSNRGVAFNKIARELVTDVHPRAVLDELLRLGLVVEENGRARMVAHAFTSKTSASDRVLFFADNARAFLSTCVENILDSRPNQLERAIWGEGMGLRDANRVHALAGKQWESARNALFEAISNAAKVDEDVEPRFRVRVGTYVNFEPM